MSKATCTGCGKVAYLQGKEYWSIKEAMQELIERLRGHKCKNG